MKASQLNSQTQYIKSFVRLKPIAIDQIPAIRASKHHVTVQKDQHERFQYNQVFGESCKNGLIFETVMLPVVTHLFEGYNACILAYGQTSSGKTYTMKGVQGNAGLIPLTIREIFHRIEHEQMIAKVRISYFEIYNENIIDLLSNETPPRYLDIRDDHKKNAIIQDLIQEEVNNEHDSMIFFDKGEANRKYASNNINFKSSRSHVIFKISMQVAHQDLTTSLSTISLVDLAGSESVSKTQAVGLLKKQSENINKSLLALSRVIINVSSKNNYINYRDSRLTRILQPCLTGKSKTVVICTINQNEESFGETINTLRFGATANSIRISAQRNIIAANTQSIALNDPDPQYQELQQLLKEERTQKEYLRNQIARLNAKITSYKDFQTSALNEINDLKYKLLMQENQNINNGVFLKQMKMHQGKQAVRNDHNFLQLEEDVKLYKAEILKLEATINQLKEHNKNYNKLTEQLSRNERTLLDRLSKYEKELSALQQSLNQQAQQQKITSRSKQTNLSEKDPPDRKNDLFFKAEPVNRTQVAQNPYTLNKVIQLSTKILQMKIQLKQYIRANTELQEENERLTAKIQFMENNYNQLQINREEPNSQKTKTSRQSGGTKYNQWEIRSIKEQLKRLKNQKVSLMKKLNQMRVLLKNNTNNHIEELHGFNKFIEKNFTQNEKEYFKFMFEEDPNDFEPKDTNDSRVEEK